MQRHLLVALLGLIQLAATHAMKCNGHDGLCKLRLDQVTFAGTHNSGANRVMKYDAKIFMVSAGSCWYRNQDYSFSRQLDFGIRFFDIDTCSKKGKAWTCHKDGYGQPLSEVIRDIANWLNNPSHRNEVIAIRFHDTKISGFAKFAPLFKSHFSGAGGKVGANAVLDRWQTLGEAVAENKRVFIFMVDKLCNDNCRRSNHYIRSSYSYDDTWVSRKVTKACNGMVEETRKSCSQRNRPLIIVSAFASHGLCISKMQKLCNPYIRPSAMACYKERKKRGKTINFLTADYVNQARRNDDVVTVARELNNLNMGH